MRGNPGAGLDVAGEGFGDANDKLEKIHKNGVKLGKVLAVSSISSSSLPHSTQLHALPLAAQSVDSTPNRSLFMIQFCAFPYRPQGTALLLDLLEALI